MKTKAQYKAANANDRVGFGGTINKGCSVPSRRSGNHPLLDRGRGGHQTHLFSTLLTLSSQKKRVENLAGFPALQSSHLENNI